MPAGQQPVPVNVYLLPGLFCSKRIKGYTQQQQTSQAETYTGETGIPVIHQDVTILGLHQQLVSKSGTFVNDEVTDLVCGIHVIIGSIISLECKTLANCVLDLNVRDLNSFIPEHRSPQKSNVTSHHHDHQERPQVPVVTSEEHETQPHPIGKGSTAVSTGHAFARDPQSLPPSLARGRSELQSKPKTRRHHLSPRSPRTALLSWCLRPQFLGY